MISSEQIKAARAWIDWTREELAEEAGVSSATVRNLEKGKISHRSSEPVRIALESKGFRFHGKNSILRIATESRTFEGPSSCDEFFDDLFTAVSQKGGEIVAIFRTQEQLARALGVTDLARLERLERLASLAAVKCLLSDIRHATLQVPSIEFRATLHNPLSPFGQIIYGDTTAIIIATGRDFVFHITKSVETAQFGLKDFMPRWESGMPVSTAPPDQS